MPAGHLPPKRENAFAGVSPRFLDPVQRPQNNYVPPEQEKYHTQGQWRGTSSRYLLGVSSHEQEKLREEQKLREKARESDHLDPLAGWSEAAVHREYAKRAIGNVSSRYAENAEQKGHPEVSPRALVSKQDETSKAEKGWRGTHALNQHTTFDVMYKKWLKQHEGDAFMKRKKNSARSPVADYFKHGTPIESTSRGASPIKGRAQTPNPNNNSSATQQQNTTGAGAGGHGSTARRRAQSPWERTQYSPDTFIGGRWKSGGVTSTGFDLLRKQSLKLNRQYALCEERANEVISHQTEVKVEKDFVPRVAKLALVYQIPTSSSSRNVSPTASRSSSLNRTSGSNNYNNYNNRPVSPTSNNNNNNRRNQSPTAGAKTVAVQNNKKSTTVGQSLMNNNNYNTNNSNNNKTTSHTETSATYSIGSEDDEKDNGIGRRRSIGSSPTRRL